MGRNATLRRRPRRKVAPPGNSQDLCSICCQKITSKDESLFCVEGFVKSPSTATALVLESILIKHSQMVPSHFSASVASEPKKMSKSRCL